MKAKSFFAASILFLSGVAFSQQTSEHPFTKNSFWALSYSYGISGIIDNNGNKFTHDEGQFASIEASYIPKGSIGYFANYSRTTFSQTSYSIDVIQNNYEVTEGIKIYSGNKRYFLSVAAGYYEIGLANLGIESDRSVQSLESFGLSFGLGGRIKIADSYGIIVNGRFHKVFVSNGEYMYAGVNAGLEINYGSQPAINNPDKKISTGFVAGSSAKNNIKPTGSYGAEITYNISEKVSLVGSYIHSGSVVPLDYDNKSYSENDYSGGMRFYTNKGNARFFMESLLDLNILKSRKEIAQFPDEIIANSLGLAIGIGTEFKLTDSFSGMMKANVTKFDQPGLTNGIYGGVRFKF